MRDLKDASIIFELVLIGFQVIVWSRCWRLPSLVTSDKSGFAQAMEHRDLGRAGRRGVYVRAHL